MKEPTRGGQTVDPTYWEYIGLHQLLSLQGGVDGRGEVEDSDELHFIIIHQAIELVFKLVLRQLREARSALRRPHLDESMMPAVAGHLAKVNEALGVASSHFSFMETLGTQGFLSFRHRLGTSSGAQSFQMRELEELLGLPISERERVLRRMKAELEDESSVQGFEAFVLTPLAAIRSRIDRQIASKAVLEQDSASDLFVLAYLDRAQSDLKTQGSLRDALWQWLFRTPICGSSPSDGADEDRVQVERFRVDYLERARSRGWSAGQVAGAESFLAPEGDWYASRVRIALLFIELYADLPLLAWPRLLLDRLVELEARLVEFRNGHARMVERVIGNRPGTGGSAGILYLDLTRDARVFPELAQVRGMLLPRGDRWAFPGIERYDFAQD